MTSSDVRTKALELALTSYQQNSNQPTTPGSVIAVAVQFEEFLKGASK